MGTLIHCDPIFQLQYDDLQQARQPQSKFCSHQLLTLYLTLDIQMQATDQDLI